MSNDSRNKVIAAIVILVAFSLVMGAIVYYVTIYHPPTTITPNLVDTIVNGSKNVTPIIVVNGTNQTGGGGGGEIIVVGNVTLVTNESKTK